MFETAVNLQQRKYKEQEPFGVSVRLPSVRGAWPRGFETKTSILQNVTDQTCDLEINWKYLKGSKKPGPGRIGKPRQTKGLNRWKAKWLYPEGVKLTTGQLAARGLRGVERPSPAEFHSDGGRGEKGRE